MTKTDFFKIYLLNNKLEIHTVNFKRLRRCVGDLVGYIIILLCHEVLDVIVNNIFIYVLLANWRIIKFYANFKPRYAVKDKAKP